MTNPLLIKKDKNNKFVDLPHSAGILDDYAVRKNVATREGTIEKVPVNNNDITNKAYVDNNFIQGVDDGDYITLYFGATAVLRYRKSDSQIQIPAGLDTDTTL